MIHLILYVVGNLEHMIYVFILIIFGRTHGDIIIAHCVDHRRPDSQKHGFYFHRLVFVSKEEAAKAFSYVEKNHFPNKFRITSKLPYRVLLDDNTRVFVNKASKYLVDFMLYESKMVLDY